MDSLILSIHFLIIKINFLRGDLSSISVDGSCRSKVDDSIFIIPLCMVYAGVMLVDSGRPLHFKLYHLSLTPLGAAGSDHRTCLCSNMNAVTRRRTFRVDTRKSQTLRISKCPDTRVTCECYNEAVWQRKDCAQPIKR